MAQPKRTKRALYYDPQSGAMRLGSVAQAPLFQILNQRWTFLLLRTLAGGPLRFNELAKHTAINPNTLRERLRELENSGVVTRTVLSSMPPKVQYELSPSGRELSKVFDAFDRWAAKHAAVEMPAASAAESVR